MSIYPFFLLSLFSVSFFLFIVSFPQLIRAQLNVERAAGRVFIGFDEPPISFPPSYKYDPGTDNYDSSEKLRTPAWCDRVLVYKVSPECSDISVTSKRKLVSQT